MFRLGKIQKKGQIPFQDPHLLRTTTAFRSAATEGIAATAAQGEPSPCPLGVQGDKNGAAPHRNTKKAGGLPAFGVRGGARTHDTQNHNLVLYQLNYSHHIQKE